MACFLIPATEAVVATVVAKTMELKEGTPKTAHLSTGNSELATTEKISFTRKLKWLTNMLWGGSALLAFEHVWHGEVTPWFPFLTAASDPADTAVMLHEMATVGVSMAVLVTAVWCVLLAATSAMEKRVLGTQSSAN